ncbi:hypothetical protein, partial [Anaerorhabdus sp.]|uniref:hypothetical protein n=1 Tax=Anaerorhabdus sp. TaxID=1872524 RepID=UPI002B20E939
NNIIMTSRATAYSVFLPYFFAFDYEKIKNTIKSGNVTCWLEKIGGGGGTKSPYKKWYRLFKKGGVNNVW